MEINDVLPNILERGDTHYYSRPHPWNFRDDATGRGRRVADCRRIMWYDNTRICERPKGD